MAIWGPIKSLRLSQADILCRLQYTNNTQRKHGFKNNRKRLPLSAFLISSITNRLIHNSIISAVHNVYTILLKARADKLRRTLWSKVTASKILFICSKFLKCIIYIWIDRIFFFHYNNCIQKMLFQFKFHNDLVFHELIYIGI